MTNEPIQSAGPATAPRRGWATACLTGILAISAVITMGYWAVQALGKEDTEALESTLILPVARQLVFGPGDLYGPFGGNNTLVLIHAPLYYRLAALGAWPLFRAGVSPIAAAMIAGRLLSILGLLATMAAAYRLARLGGGPRLSGWWAALIIAGSPVLMSQPYSVRPDMLGIALQTGGLLLVLSALGGGPGSRRRIVGGYVVFGLAICVKQHLVAEASVCTALLFLDRRRSAIPLATIVASIATGLAIALVVYGVETVITQGHILEAVFVAAGQVSRVHRGGWSHVFLINYGLIRRNAGLLVLLPMIGLTIAGYPRGILRRIVILVGIVLVCTVLANLALDIFLDIHNLEIASYFIALGAGLIFLACGFSGRTTLLGDRIDGILWLCLAVELGLVYLLSYLSTGSWLNYGIQSAVLGAVLVGRAASRVIEAAPRPRALWPLAAGVLAVLLSSYGQVRDAALLADRDRAAVEAVFEHLKMPRSAVFFVDQPGLNRLDGRLELVYDHWLYPVFESAHLAEARSAWISQKLLSRNIRAIVLPSEEPVIKGTGIQIRSFGFLPGFKLGPFYVSTR